MKNIFNPGTYPKNIDWVLFILRVSIGVLMLTHGWGKFLKLIGDDPIQFADPIGIGQTASLGLTVFSEVLCSVLLIVGFATRFASIPLLITMLVAVFIVHANDGFGKQELPLIYSLVYLVIALAGAGKLSLDNFIYGKINSK